MDGEADAARHLLSSDSWAPTAGSASRAPRPTLYALLWPCAEFSASGGVSSWCRRERVRSQQVERGQCEHTGHSGPTNVEGRASSSLHSEPGHPPSAGPVTSQVPEAKPPPLSAPPSLDPSPAFPRSSSLSLSDTVHPGSLLGPLPSPPSFVVGRPTASSKSCAPLRLCPGLPNVPQGSPSECSRPCRDSRPAPGTHASPGLPLLALAQPPGAPFSLRCPLPSQSGRKGYSVYLTAVSGSVNRHGQGMSQET